MTVPRRTAFIALLLLLAVLAGCSLLNNDDTGNVSTPTATPTTGAATITPIPEPTATATPTPEPTPVSPVITIADQELDEDGILTAREVSLPDPGWLVIYNDADGRPGDIIGRQSLAAGIHEQVEVTIDPHAATGLLYAGLHMDGGVGGVFEYPGADEPYPGEPEAEFTVEILLPQPIIEATDQDIGENGVVTLARVELLEPSWVLIHSDSDGAIGPVVGGVRLDEGLHENVSLAIDWRKATPALYAVLHEDGGEIGVIDFPGGDMPILRNGKPIVAAFKAKYPPEVLVYDQPVIDGTVVIERAISDGPGWVAVYQETEGQPGFIIGSAPLEDGLNERVVVDLNESALTTQLFARLHHDSEPGDAFNFPGQDPPVLYNNRMPNATAFRTDRGAHVVVRDQPLGEGNSVTVEVVVTPVNTWVAIYNDADGLPGSLLGQTRILPGVRHDVVVELESPPRSDIVHLMLYQDLGEAEVFEPPSNDVPLTNNTTRAIRVPFTILPPASR